MQFESFAEFIAMGGHALYVWLAYGSTLAVLISSTLLLRMAHKRQLVRLRWQMQAEAGSAAADKSPASSNFTESP